MRGKLRCAIIGPGNIGMDLMVKLLRSSCLEVALVAGVDPHSKGLGYARERGIMTTADGIGGVLAMPDLDICFDATSAEAHLNHAPMLKEAGIFAVDLTPAAVGPYVVPSVNLERNLGKSINVNLITCGGQATIPIVKAISRITPVAYAEIVATISSLSAGPSARANIDEFTATTRNALVSVGGAEKAKAIIILNPAVPPIMMRNTVYVQCATERFDEIARSVRESAASVRQYVPGYSLKVAPYIDGERLVSVVEVDGSGDYLPAYAGNLDIITAAAVEVGECYAQFKEKAVL